MTRRNAKGQFIKGNFKENHPNWKGKILRSGYFYIKMPEHPFCGKQGYVAEHRLIMEKYLGRFLKKEEVVHHINGVITDNRLENLILFFSHGQHTKFAHPETILKSKITNIGKHHSSKTEFKKGLIPWNKGTKGLMPVPWNKGLKYGRLG